MGVSCIVFYSLPIEASKTAIIRGLEVCCCKKVYVLSTSRHSNEVKELCRLLGRLIGGIEFKALPIIPDVEESPELINEVAVRLKELGLGKEPACFIASAGSRLEVASMALILDRSLTDVIYVSFLWGPWGGTYYPFTPKPIQLVHILHPGIEAFNSCTTKLNIRNLEDLLNSSTTSRLRKEVLKSQLLMNYELNTKCVAHKNDISCKCPKLMVSISYGGRELISIEISDYCSWDEVIKLCSDLNREVTFLCDSVNQDVLCSTLSTILNVSGIRLLTIKECMNVKCVNTEGLALIDFLRDINDVIIIDTNLIYQGIHNYLYEHPMASNIVSIPLSTYVELYEHQVHASHMNLYAEVRAELSKLLLTELSYFKPRTEVRATVRPSEVSIALIPEGVAVTSDRKAYERLYKWLGRRSILTEPTSLSDVRFKSNERSRRVSYAYYSIAQLKALSKLLSNVLRKYRLSIDVRLT